MEDNKKQALDEIAMQNLSPQETIERLRIVFETVELCHLAIAFASSEIVNQAIKTKNDGTEITASIMRSRLSDINRLKALALCLKQNTKNDKYEDFI